MRAYAPAAVILLFIVTPASAQVLPPELIFKGRPVEPYCLDLPQDSAHTEPVDLAHCLPDSITPSDAQWRKDGSYGYIYRYTHGGSLSMPYVYYRYLGKLHALPVVLVISSGGGTGHFDRVLRLAREGDTLKLKEEMVSGDRCNGGLSKVHIEHDALFYEQKITPFDFLTLADDNPHNLTPYEALEASAASCFGVARYEGGKLRGVRLKTLFADTLNGRPDWTEQYQYQSCFNRIYREYVGDGRTELSPDGLKEFTHRFNTECVENKGTNNG